MFWVQRGLKPARIVQETFVNKKRNLFTFKILYIYISDQFPSNASTDASASTAADASTFP